LKTNFSIDVMAGNIATSEAARDLIEAGADGLKVGIGPSPVCSTRTISGAGVPQLTAIIDVVKVAKEFNVPVCADGGMRYPGDVVKALAAGASSIFSGSFFSGTKEAPGMIVFKDGKRFKRYMGSASYESNHERKENQEGKEHKERLDVFVEGVSTLVDYKGPVTETIKNLIKGVKSGLSYCGAYTIKEMQEKAEFIQITQASWEESKTHGIKLSE
ncbi:IMP dehydrogenase, partial [Candidatus Woesearchaeota archaeon]|nr:IMP dehydrogenase [Candidatus Woesearchaeota archaeon]